MIDLTRPRAHPKLAANRRHGRFGDVPIEHWAALVREARRRRRLSQTALAQAAEVTQQTISKVETGDICPHDRLKIRLAIALDLPPAELFPWPATR